MSCRLPSGAALWIALVLAGGIGGCVESESRSTPPGPAPVVDTVHGEIPPPRPGFRWGVYQIYTGAGRYRGRLSDATGELASPPQLVMFYRDLGRGFPRSGCDIIREAGATPVVSLELWRWGDRRQSYLAAIADGTLDDYFRQWATDARDYADPVFLRFGFEMNGDWFSWGNQPELYIRAWKRVRHIFQESGAKNVQWVWAPNNVSIPRTAENAIEVYYPGKGEVDWLGVDGYNFGDHHDEWHHWESFDAVFTPALDCLERLAPEKPILIAEFAAAAGESGQKARWIVDAYRSIQARPRVMGAIWFNLDKRREGEPDWRIASDPGSLEAFNLTFASPAWHAASASQPRAASDPNRAQ
ncbi:MAG: hypothetical protein KC729_00825 [Candidatus Eisenbacteria bacterium]|uniref:GH26 domain-containing protein n=1 Tax=Eiseniibacteriota bacterium TaxID=2212470 RepID=A0A956LUY5_UNCEI|nr:hypothetical protein [Candidatus Eisenbacteria bacterium]